MPVVCGLQGNAVKQGLHESQLKLYAEEKTKFETIVALNSSEIIQKLNGNAPGGRGRAYPNLKPCEDDWWSTPDWYAGKARKCGIFAGNDSVHVSCSYAPISFWHQTFLSRKVNLVVYISVTVFKAQRNSQALPNHNLYS